MTVDMSVNNVDDMFDSFQSLDYARFLGSPDPTSEDLGFLFINSRKDKIKTIPVKVIGKDIIIQRMVDKRSTLQDFLEEIAGLQKSQPVEQ